MAGAGVGIALVGAAMMMAWVATTAATLVLPAARVVSELPALFARPLESCEGAWVLKLFGTP